MPPTAQLARHPLRYAFVRSDSGKEQTSRAQPRPKQTRTTFLPSDDLSKLIEIPLCSNDSFRFRGRYFTSIAGPTQDPRIATSFWPAYRLPWFAAIAMFDRGFAASGNKLGTKNVNKPFRTLSVA